MIHHVSTLELLYEEIENSEGEASGAAKAKLSKFLQENFIVQCCFCKYGMCLDKVTLYLRLRYPQTMRGAEQSFLCEGCGRFNILRNLQAPWNASIPLSSKYDLVYEHFPHTEEIERYGKLFDPWEPRHYELYTVSNWE